MSFKITWKTHVVSMVIALLITLLLYHPINRIIENYVSSSIIIYPTGNILINFYIQVFVILLIVSVIHELIHSFMYKLFGGKTKCGFKFIFAYTQEVSGLALKRVQFLIVLMAPVVVISLLSTLFGHIGGLAYFVNLLGSYGDVYMVLNLQNC